jgi:hypothetical protein
MKFTFLIALLFPVFCLANPINVTATGKTYEEAKYNAFREAIEYKIGTVIVSEREQENLKLARNSILAYSAGYVDKFKVVSVIDNGDRVQLVVDVYVSSSRISDLILSKSNSATTFDSHRHTAQQETYIEERNGSDRLVWSVMRHYPKRAFDIEQLPYQLKVDNYRNLSLVIPYTISWNQNFINSFNELMNNIDSKAGFFQQKPGTVTVHPIPHFFAVSKDKYKFDDLTHINLIRNQMQGNREMRIKLTLRNLQNQVVMDQCFYPRFLSGYQRAFYDLGDPKKIKLFGSVQERHNINIPLPNNVSDSIIRGLYSIKLELVAHENCNI